MMPPNSLFLLLLSWATLTVLINGIVPPKTPVISGFEPAAIGTYRELVCEASQPDAGTITYKWYKYADPDKHGNTWESRGPFGKDQKRYLFDSVSEKHVFYPGQAAEPVSGKYKCRATNTAGTRDSDWGDLYVYTPCPHYTGSVSPAKPVVGSTFTLNCYIPNPSGLTVFRTIQRFTSSHLTDVAIANSKGCHTPTNTRYSWSSCSPPSPSSKTFNLQVTNAQTSDFGYWICKDMGLSCISDPVKIVVQVPPGTPQITGFPTGPATAGAQVNLKCEALPLGDKYDWYRDGIKQTTSLTYNFQVKKESAGVYKCVARNTAGILTSSNKTLIVYSKSDSVVVSSGKTSCYAGETDRFTCTATGGYPKPTLKIYIKRSGGTRAEVIQGQDRAMAKEDNQAEYYCEANVAGYNFNMTSTKKTYNVTFPHTKVSFIDNPTSAVQVGQVKKFTCETDGSNPVARIVWNQYVGVSWQKATSGIKSLERNSAFAYGGKIRISELSITATKDINARNIRCISRYSLTGHNFTTSADTVLSVKWSATELKMVEKPGSPIVAGTSVNIKCETDSSNSGSPGSISWYRNGQEIMTGVTPSTRSATDGGTIYISQLTVTARKEDKQAKYECKINDQADFKKDITIAVHFPPNGIQLSETSITVREGESKTITCSTTSSSNPVVSDVSVKKRLGSTVVDVTGTSSVTDGTYGKDVSIDIKLDTNRTDNGAQYICSFTYSSTSFTKNATVNVQWSVTELLMVDKPNSPIVTGASVNIKCETDSSNSGSPGAISWSRNGQQITTGVTPSTRSSATDGSTIYISQLTVTAKKEDNRAKYECKIKDLANVKKEVTITVHWSATELKMVEKPKSPITAGTSVNIKCETNNSNSGSPETISWYRNGQQITTGVTPSERSATDGGTIYISQLTVTTRKEDNQAKYECKISDQANFKKDVTITVHWSATELKMVEKPNSPITVGTSVNIKCETDSSKPGSPGTISWYRNGQQITTGVFPGTRPDPDGGTIYISQVTVTTRKEDNQAKYECKINDQANFEKDVTITVHWSATELKLVEKPNSPITAGTSVNIKCETDSSNPGSPGTILWNMNGKQITTGVTQSTRPATDGGTIYISQLTVTARKEDNQAKYECKINDQANFKKDVTITVNFNPSKITIIQNPGTAILEGQLITIVCETDSANPAADIQFHRKRTGETWLKQTSGITSEDRNATQYNGMIRKSTLTVTANRTDNQADFECKVKNAEFEVKKTTSVVTIYYPPTVLLSSKPKTVKERENLTLTCEASGGNPTAYTYSWYYKNLKQSGTTKDHTITGIKYTQSGKYKCEAINYSPGGKAHAITDIDVLYKAKWNPALPELFTVASKASEPVKFVLYVIAKPPPTKVTWFYQNGTKIGKSFTAFKVNDTTYTLNKTYVTIKDYGNYTVNVTNPVGVSTFVFELQQAGPPLPPCCLKMVNKTAVSVYLTFKSNFSGGSDQTFTIEQSPEGSRRKRSEGVKAAEKIPDPGFEKDVFPKVKGLKSGTTYQFRVKAVNADGSSGYNDPGNGNFLQVTTKDAPNADLDVTRKDNIVAVSWGLERVYSKIQIEYCPVKGGGPCLYHDVESPAKQGSTKFDVNKEQTYKYSLVVFDGDDKVFVSSPQQPPPPPLNYVAIGGGAGAGFLLLLIIIAVIVAVVFIKKRRAEKGNGKLVTNSITAEGTVNVAFNDPDDIDGGINPYADSGMNPYTDSDMNPYADSIEMAAFSSSTIQVEGAPGATYAVVNKGNKKPLLGGKGKKNDALSGSQAYADVDFSKKLKKGKGKNKPTPETGEAEKAYDVIDFSKKRKGAAQSKPDGSAEQAYDVIDFSKKKKGAAPSKPDGPDGAVYAQVNKKPPVGDEYAQVDFNKKGSKKDAVRDTPGDVYAVVNKPTKPDKLPKPGTSNDEAVYANVNGMAEGNVNGVAEGNVNGMAEDDIYEDVRDDALIMEGYKQPKTAYQVGVDGTIYSEVRIKPPKNPDVIIGKETIEDPYDSVDFTKEAPPLISNPDDPNDSGFIDLI